MAVRYVSCVSTAATAPDVLQYDTLEQYCGAAGHQDSPFHKAEVQEPIRYDCGAWTRVVASKVFKHVTSIKLSDAAKAHLR